MDRTSRATLFSLALTTMSALAAGLASGIAVHALLRQPQATPAAAQPNPIQPSSVATSAKPTSSSAEITHNPIYPLGPVMASLRPSPAPTLDHDSPRWSQLGLTHAEIRIAQRIVKGRSFSSIAAELGVTDQSVRKTASRIYRKAGVGRRQDFTAQMGTPPAPCPGGAATSSAAPSVAPPGAASFPPSCVRYPASPLAQTPHGNIPSTRSQ